MSSEFFLGPVHLQTFSFVLALALVAGLILAAQRRGETFAAWVDLSLVSLAGGFVGARIFHILLNWNYFADNLNEAVRLNAGGLDWHGAVLGGLAGLGLASRWRRQSFRETLDAFTPLLPLIALASWVGCAAVRCAYGAEVDTLANYSSFAVSEARDLYSILAPRYNTQLFGVLLAFGLLLLTLIILWRRALPYRRFWLLLALLSFGMLMIGFYRGDAVPLIAGFRADQWLDGVLIVFSLQRLLSRQSAAP